ncbi:MAG TPA: CoA transferase, partial [Candidatus Poseidoniaceae archaeon]
MFRPLEGVRVLDLSRVLAGPYAAKLLQDLGADVLRVEAPWGDDTRGWGPPFTEVDGEEVAAYWTSVNLGKQVIRRDLRKEEDLEDVRRLVANADVILENFRPGRAEAWFAPWPERAVVCSITAYGNDGPRRDEGGYDLAMQARSGLMGITGDAEGGPAKVGVAVIDVVTGLHAGAAVLAALFRREREGVGSRLTLSLWDCALDLLINQAQNALVGGTNPGRMGTAHPNLVPYRAFQAANGEVA